jgi:hypothetical protein
VTSLIPKRRSRRAKPSAMLQQWSLGQLRWAFLCLGLVLVGSVLGLTYAMHKRLVAAERDREEMVALRVFDELEREISAFLETENQREPYQSLEQTNPELWAPFVVGYFKLGSKEEYVAADGATTENRRRMTWSLQQLRDKLGQSAPAVPVQVHTLAPAPAVIKETKRLSAQPGRLGQDKREAEQPAIQSQEAASGSKIIDSLNRAPERRKQQSAPKASAPSGKADPFTDYAGSY